MWRAKNQKQAKGKMDIYNSREWKELRALKLRTNPLCEVCQAEGYVTSAHAVHHRHPIEDSSSKEEMRRWAFDWANLVSVCDACHAKIHKEAGKGTGLGLAIAAQVVEDHGGTISVQDRPGGGTAFTVELPRTRTLPPET